MEAASTCRVVIIVLLAVVFARNAEAQGIIVDHTSLPLFEQIPEQYLTAAANLTMMFTDRSVGANINDGLSCLGYPSDEAAPSACKRYVHVVPQFSSPQSQVNWARPGGYNRSNWVYFGWPGAGIPPELPCGVQAASWYQKLECFIRYVDANPTRYSVYSYQNSYLEVESTSDIASLTTGYFVSQPNRYDITDFEAMEARHPSRKFLHHTTSLARGIGNQVATDFNNRMRDYVRTHNKVLLDVADIESYDPSGNRCYDNRDGVSYTNGGASENYPNDGVSFSAICQHYTRESEGGHLGNPDSGKIRLAKAFWIAMARIAGWNPVGGGVNNPPDANAQSVTTDEDSARAITLSGSDPNGDPLTFRLVTQPSHGPLTGTGASLTYTPNANYHGPDSFTFVANDGQADSTAKTVTLSVTAVADPPVAWDDAGATEANTPIVMQVLTNDVDVDGDPLTVTAVGSPDSGTVANNGNTITYTPSPGFSGSGNFSYTVSDGTGSYSTALVSITVAPPSGSGHALRFDGVNDFVNLPPMAQMMAPGWQSTKTVELWVKPTGSSSCGAPNPISCDLVFGDKPRWWGITRGIVNGADRIWVWNTNASGSPSAIGMNYTLGEWTHIALVHSGGTLSAYKNGVLAGSVPSGPTGQPANGTPPILQLGGVIMTPTRVQTFQGDIDEVRIWNTVRSAQELNQNMNTLLQGTEPGLVAYYQMSDGVGTSLTDDSGHGLTGSLQDGGGQVPADGPILWVSP